MKVRMTEKRTNVPWNTLEGETIGSLHRRVAGVDANRKKRKQMTARTSHGVELRPMLCIVMEADAYGRPTKVRIAYPEEKVSAALDDAGVGEGARSDDTSRAAHTITIWVGDNWKAPPSEPR